jgi:hypothetical protein
MRAIAFQSNTGTSSGISLSSTNAPLRLEATNALYPSSDGGATVSCVEINADKHPKFVQRQILMISSNFPAPLAA